MCSLNHPVSFCNTISKVNEFIEKKQSTLHPYVMLSNMSFEVSTGWQVFCYYDKLCILIQQYDDSSNQLLTNWIHLLEHTLFYFLFISEVSAYFKPGTSVAYTFKEPYELNKNASSQSSSIYSDLTLRGESIAFSFRTTQAPALLLYVNSYYREYLAVVLNRNGELNIRSFILYAASSEFFSEMHSF